MSLKLVVGTYGRRHSCVQWKKHPRSSSRTFIVHLLNSNYEKLAECNPTLRRDKFFPILPKYWQVSKYTALLSEFSFPKWEKIKFKFRMINLCNGGTKDFVKLWEILHLKIWTHFSIRQTKLFWINLKHYSQRLRVLSPSKQIPLQSLMIRQPRPLFCLSNEKSPSKTTTNQLFLQKKFHHRLLIGL